MKKVSKSNRLSRAGKVRNVLLYCIFPGFYFIFDSEFGQEEERSRFLLRASVELTTSVDWLT